jgi:hypothetical protein
MVKITIGTIATPFVRMGRAREKKEEDQRLTTAACTPDPLRPPQPMPTEPPNPAI